MTNIPEVLGARTSNVILNTSIHDTAPDQTRSREKGFSQGSESCARDVKCAMAQLKVRELQEVQAIKENEIELRLQEENTRVSTERERLRLRSQLTQAKIDAERAELEVTFREQVGDGSVTSPAGSVWVRENVEHYLTGLTSFVIPGQLFEDERVKPETGRYPVDSRAICKFCDGTHELEKCFKFWDKRYAQRKDFVRKQNLCENFLKPNHIARRCRSLGACL